MITVSAFKAFLVKCLRALEVQHLVQIDPDHSFSFQLHACIEPGIIELNCFN